ncbi:hypothetical protein [Flavobacterium sp.]|uniref:hypothetical protein n=1 Tax=Flavobacterium sp. TaxID=239 RepID=UPI0025FD26A0|nr:hypothetical protein [Flavobacterium sp.]
MKHRNLLLTLINDEDENALMRWVGAQPLLDQPEILRELKELLLELSEDEEEALTLAATFDAAVDDYEDKILDEKLAEAQLQIALQAQEKAAQEIDEATKGVRAYVIDCIVTNAPNAAAMRELAEKIMVLEKEQGTFDPANWKPLV